MTQRLNYQTSPFSLRQLMRSALALMLPKSLFIVEGPKHSNNVYLTFSDGPHREHTPRLLEVLREYNVRATFFLLGSHIYDHPDIVHQIDAEGHAIGLHTFHRADPETVTADALIRELRATEDLLRQLMNIRAKLFRPPHGKLSASKLWRLVNSGYQTVLWNVDPKDYRCRSAEELESWFAENPVQSGDIVLMHDVHPYAAEALPNIIADARGRGLEFGKLA